MADKKVPLRMCVVCRSSKPKKELIRIVKNENDFVLDATGKMNGRGSYICNNDECMTKLIKQKYLNKVFKCNIDKSQYDKLEVQFFGSKEN